MFSVVKPSSDVLDALLGEQSREELSYAYVGATRSSLPYGYRLGRRVVGLGDGAGVFERASEGLRRWQAHLRAGVGVRPADAGLEEGLAVVLAVPVAFVHVTVACRIVYVIDEPRRFGFAYGTLPHHVIEGEEVFIIERDEADAVRFVVSAFFRPRGPVMAAGAPLVHALDQRLVGRYLRGLQQHVAEQAHRPS